MAKILRNVYTESVLIEVFAKYILSQLYSHYTRNFHNWRVVDHKNTALSTI